MLYGVKEENEHTVDEKINNHGIPFQIVDHNPYKY
jgi:hypothetical protein